MKTDSLDSTFSHSDVEIEQVETVFQGFFKMERYTLKHRLYAGGWSNTFQREMMERGNAAGILLYDPKLDQVVLVEQFRIGAMASSGTSPWVLEIVAGMIDTEQSAQQVAEREAVEEAGLVVKRLKAINSFMPGAGGLSERIFLFVGEVDSSKAGGVHGLEYENEDILVKVLSREQAYSGVVQGQIDNAAAVIALQYLQLNHMHLREQWS
ncbi:ADP-ribose diphosphatase [Alginatibacterium sediminis]|uniref:ADP-ribose pyrophosphatase n=1 Tax=Alginatibacterium sediminis TaxID=2164068 RepID=A0A420ECR1_9ALTE|nr:ADP-ribose diphosphatase [Alginatibacterium sediminis]RKF18451.1 ADP-ribose diphosphatase [Alginatibacterium sediminis]